ncbi:hypothetical protein IAT40_006721 [Kwoniella sp. CBS 6097]
MFPPRLPSSGTGSGRNPERSSSPSGRGPTMNGQGPSHLASMFGRPPSSNNNSSFGRGSGSGSNGESGMNGQRERQQQMQRQIVHPDDAIRQTDDDAASSRLSAVNAGYLVDPFVSLLYKSSSLSHAAGASAGASQARKPPLINVGTHHRTVGIDLVVDKFLQKYGSGGRNAVSGTVGGDSGQFGDGCQVVSLGAGSDTRFWRLMSRPHPPNITKYVEIDFPHLTSPKAQRIARSKKLQTAVNYTRTRPSSEPSGPSSSASTMPASDSGTYKVSQGGTRLDSSIYTLLPLDLRPTPSSSSASSTSSSTSSPSHEKCPKSIHGILTGSLLPLLNPNTPTLFLAECLFPYMPPEDASAIIGWFGSTFESCVGVVYEMCGLDDGFGRVMRRNLASRNLSIPGSIFPTPASQGERFLDAPALGEGVFSTGGAKTLWQVREDVIDQAELRRISKLEILDEIEELKLVLEHYVIAWGTKGVNMDDVGL